MKNSLQETSYKLSDRKGISLIVLVITIIVALILIAATVISASRTIDNASINTFAKDLTEIQNATESYFASNNAMPSLDTSAVMDKNELLGISRSSDILLSELTENNDLDAQFYTIDMNKINVTKAAYGNGKLGANDIFVIAYPSMNVYYPYGIDAKNTTYFSITSRMSNQANISQNKEDTSAISVISSGSITVTKNSSIANKMGVKIEADMALDESLYMSVSGGTNRLITTSAGQNTFGFDTLTDVVNHTSTIQVLNITQAEADYIELGTKPMEDRYVDILKYKNAEIIGKVRIDLSNFSKILPTIASATLSSYSGINMVKLLLTNNDNGIKEVRYEYLTKYGEDGIITDYYNGITDFDSTYMKDHAKKAKLSGDLTTIIDAPKNVKSIKVAIIDNSGNVNLYNQLIAPNLYIGYTLDSTTTQSLQLTANMYSLNGIKSIAFSRSEDGVTFTNQQTFTLNTTTNGLTTQQNIAYKNFVSNTAFIKMVAVNYDNTVTETRIVKVNLTTQEIVLGLVLGVGVIAPDNATVNGLPASYDNPIIPKGFKAVNVGTVWPTDWNSGLVIEDAYGNQFVWVPVNGENVTYQKWCTTYMSYEVMTDDTLPAGVVEATEVATYGGFYIARYEAAFDYNGGSLRAASKKSTGVDSATWTNKRNSTHNGYLWNSIMYTEAKSYAEAMAGSYGYDTTKVVTALATGTQWDTTVKWFQSTGTDVLDSRSYGNYANPVAPANIVGFNTLQISSFSEYWKVNNIYDMAGNAWELTNEIDTANRVYRGGCCTNDATAGPVAARNSTTPTGFGATLAFRMALFIK